ncbi:MAG: class I SAM-dependent methyltransferase [Oscillospiraceae bacterium]|nr:class I SAM-dependent methyltransferase [Oscillospiraceae bacterium]
MTNVTQANIDRFSGFTGLYNAARPVPPEIITKIILVYLPSPPELVIDIGSGTGLSTVIWRDFARKIIGIEPGDDMRQAAQQNAPDIPFQAGYSNQTGLASNCADIVTISQAFHWMDIPTTLDEVWRILKPGGLLAVYDADWPPSVDYVVEKEYKALMRKCNAVKPPASKNDKDAHLRRLREFGKFRFVKEAVCHSAEACTPERMIGIALSQGSVQGALKLDASIQEDVDAFCAVVKERCPEHFEIVFSYRLRLAIK